MSLPAFPLVTVVIAFLNEERFLAEAVESVLQQTYAHWELILVDDGSTDQSTGLAQRYAQRRRDQIRYCEHEGHVNRGLSASRNEGIRRGRGQLIALLDADDAWLADKLTQQVALFHQHPGIAMVAEASRYWYSWQPGAPADVMIPVGAPAGRVYPPRELLFLLYPLGAGAAPCPSGLMLERQALLAAGGFEESFTQHYQLYEDQAFLHKIYVREKVYVSASCGNYYRQRPGSIVQTVTQNGQYHVVRRYFLEWFAAYLRREGLGVAHVEALLARALVPYHFPLTHRFLSAPYQRLRQRVNTFFRFSA
ncbi:glycosyltransferase family 2 protein [Hymenobacter sp. HD11105]